MNTHTKMTEFYTRQDGKLALSLAEKRLAEQRITAKDSRIWRRLGTDDTFSPEFKQVIRDDYEEILDRVYLEKELAGARRVVKALKQHPEIPETKQLISRLRSDPIDENRIEILCPVWRHLHARSLTAASVPRYFFPEKSSEVALLTVVLDFAENLYELEDQIKQARVNLMNIVSAFTKSRKGIVILGLFEPDLRSNDELTNPNSDFPKLLERLGKRAPDAGGWVLSGHFLVRVAVFDDLRKRLKQYYPAGKVKWNRIQINPIRKDKPLAASVMDVLGYAAKYPAQIFDGPTRGVRARQKDAYMEAIQTVFCGPSWSGTVLRRDFDLDAAICQWALFVDRMGPENMYFAVESCHAQKWYSQSELQCIREFDLDFFSAREQRVELHRDHDFSWNKKVPKRYKGKFNRIRTRALQYDLEWYEETDLGSGPFCNRAFTFDRWPVRKVSK